MINNLNSKVKRDFTSKYDVPHHSNQHTILLGIFTCITLTNNLEGGMHMEKFYDSCGNLKGYVKCNKIYDCRHCLIGYIECSTIYDKDCTPLAVLNNGVVYSIDGMPLGFYDDNFRLYSIDGRYLGYGNFGFTGLLGSVLLLGLLSGGFGWGWGWGWRRPWGLGWGWGWW